MLFPSLLVAYYHDLSLLCVFNFEALSNTVESMQHFLKLIKRQSTVVCVVVVAVIVVAVMTLCALRALCLTRCVNKAQLEPPLVAASTTKHFEMSVNTHAHTRSRKHTHTHTHRLTHARTLQVKAEHKQFMEFIKLA